jgi:hypothetical protein
MSRDQGTSRRGDAVIGVANSRCGKLAPTLGAAYIGGPIGADGTSGLSLLADCDANVAVAAGTS